MSSDKFLNSARFRIRGIKRVLRARRNVRFRSIAAGLLRSAFNFHGEMPGRTLSHGYSCRARNFISAVAKLRGVKVEKLNPGAWNLSTRAAPRLFRYLVDLLATFFLVEHITRNFLRGSYLTFQLYAHGVALGFESIGFISFGEKSEISARATSLMNISLGLTPYRCRAGITRDHVRVPGTLAGNLLRAR